MRIVLQCDRVLVIDAGQVATSLSLLFSSSLSNCFVDKNESRPGFFYILETPFYCLIGVVVGLLQ